MEEFRTLGPIRVFIEYNIDIDGYMVIIRAANKIVKFNSQYMPILQVFGKQIPIEYTKDGMK